MIYLHIYTIDKDIKLKSKELLNLNLAKYLNTKKYTIRYNDNGKPTTNGINFSVSHSKNKVVQVFCFDSELGVDIEFIKQQRNFLKLSKRYFHTHEYKTLKALDNNTALILFYRLWTAKESVCKAQGGRLWYFLKNNLINNQQQIKNKYDGLTIIQLDEIKDFSLTLATENPIDTVKLIHE